MLLQEKERRKRNRKLFAYYPESGPLSRDKYPKHMQFFREGAQHRERLFLAANRTGKTEGAGGYETTLHLTGRYPDWWEGRRFEQPISAWAAGDTSKTVRDILQVKLLGPTGSHGTGLIPAEDIHRVTSKQGVTDAIEDIFVRHASGGYSQLTLKSYDQRRESFQGTEKHVLWLDEEPPMDIYTECLLRTTATDFFEGGIIMATFTPLSGLTEVVLSFMPQGNTK